MKNQDSTNGITLLNNFIDEMNDIMLGLTPHLISISSYVDEYTNWAISEPPYINMPYFSSESRQELISLILKDVNPDKSHYYNKKFKELFEIINGLKSFTRQNYEDVCNTKFQNGIVKEFKERGLIISGYDYLQIIEELTEFCTNIVNSIWNELCDILGLEEDKQKNKLNVKTFPEHLMHKQRILLAEKLKGEFKTEKGKSIKLMFEALREKDPSILIIENGHGKEIYISLKEYFQRDIGTYQSINDVKDWHDSEFEAINSRVEFILKSIDNKD